MHSLNPIAIAALSWRDFERLIGETFRRRGYQVTGFGSHAADGAADLALVKTGERFLVQCKHWRKHEMGVLAVRELQPRSSAVGAQGGYVLTAGGFTREAANLPADAHRAHRRLARSSPGCEVPSRGRASRACAAGASALPAPMA